MAALTDFEPVFAQLIEKSGVSEKFKQWLKDSKVFEVDGYGYLASVESDVKVEILEVAKAKGVDIAVLSDKSGAKKLWVVCRNNMKTDIGADAKA